MKRYALLVGINDYPDPDARLVGAQKDAESFKEVLDKDFDKIILLTNKNATSERILGEIRKIKEIMHDDDIFLFYFSGHGTEINDNAYIDAHDRRINIDNIRRVTDTISIKRFFIFDCCRGATFDSMKEYPVIHSAIPAEFPIIPPVILSACSAGQFAREDTMHGYFTQRFLKILKDKQITNWKHFLDKLDRNKIPGQDFEITKSGATDILLLKHWKQKYVNVTQLEFPRNEMLYRQLFYSCTDDTWATHALRLAAEASNVYAQFYYAQFLCNEKKFDQSLEWANKAIQQNCEVAKLIRAEALHGLKNYREAFDIFKDFAQKDVHAQFRLGCYYCCGLSAVEINPEKGFFWLRKAGDAGHPEAIKQVIDCLRKGYGCKKDILKAKEYDLRIKAKKIYQQAKDTMSQILYNFS